MARAAQDQRTVQLIGARPAKLAIGVVDGEKSTVQARVAEILRLPKRVTPTHAADALCIALAGLKKLSSTLTVVSAGATSWFEGVDEALRVGNARGE